MEERGFTLIEIIVVLALITLMTVIALPSLTSYFRISLKTTARELASTIKQTYHATTLTGRVHRIVYDLKSQEYWSEQGPATVLLDTAESREREERRKRFQKLSEAEQAPPTFFSLNRNVTRKRVALPRGVRFKDIIVRQGAEPVKQGQAYTHFFPHGVIEPTLIHFVDEAQHSFSLVISSTVGKTDFYERNVEPTEAFGK